MLLTATIDAVSPATPRALHVRLRLDAPFSFAPGQAALVGAHGSGERRPYSIAVGPEEAARSGCLEFLIGLGADGTPGPHLPRAEPGERVDVEGPLGAFTFPHAKGAKLFLPTVHVHDGEVHKTAEFDHELYLQPKNASQMLPAGWQESMQPAGLFLKIKETGGLISADLHCYRMKLRGKLTNADMYIA